MDTNRAPSNMEGALLVILAKVHAGLNVGSINYFPRLPPSGFADKAASVSGSIGQVSFPRSPPSGFADKAASVSGSGRKVSLYQISDL